MYIEEDTLVAQEDWATSILEKCFDTSIFEDEELRTFVDCVFGCSGSCEGCEGTSHCGNTYDD